MHLDIDSFYILDVVIKEGSFAKAAEKLNRTQSSVSYQIKKLEENLGTELFDRSQYRAELTSIGKTILEEGRKLLGQAHRLKSMVEELQEGWEPGLKLVIDGILPIKPIMNVLKIMADRRVPTLIQVKMEFLGGVHYRFQKENADIMLVKDFETSPHLFAEPLPEIDCTLTIGTKHPLATAKIVGKDQLNQYVELTVHDSSEHEGQSIDRQLFGVDRVFYLSGFHSKREALLLGLGFGWMPSYLIQEDLAAGLLKELPYQQGSRYQFVPMLVNRVERPLGKAGMMLRCLLQEMQWEAKED